MTTAPLFRPLQLRQAFASFPTGVVAVCSVVNGRPDGIAASSFTSVSLEPALVSVCIANTSTTWPRLRPCPRIGINVLADVHAALCRALSAKTGDRFAGAGWSSTDAGSVFLDDAVLRLDCSVTSEVQAGDHTIVVLQIHHLEHDATRAPLVFHASRFHRLPSD